MKFFTYLVCWDEFHENCVSIEKEFKSANQPIKVINSGSILKDSWENVGDIRYYRQLHYAMKNFDSSYDYMAFMCGDVSYNDWKGFIGRANQVLSTYDNIGLYAPHLTYEPWNENSTKLKQSQYDEDLLVSSNTDGILFVMHKDIVAQMLEYFNFLEKDPDFKNMTSGWGVDLIWSALAVSDSKIIIRDNRHIITHPKGSSYGHDKATQEVIKVMSVFNEFCIANKMDSDKIKLLIDKITGRMSHDKSCMSYNDFYSDDFHSVKNNNEINYHIIHIDDTRKQNRDLIDKTLKSNRLNINCLNARDSVELEAFMLNNKEFKLGWDGFKLGEIGNFGSHYLAWKYLLDSKLDNLLIFEDDSLIKDDFIEKYNIALNNTPQDFDVLSIYVDPNQYPRFDDSHKVNDYVSSGYQDWSTLCYVVSRQGAQKMIDYVKKNGMDYPTDWFIFRRGHEGIFNVYTLTPDFQPPVEIDRQYESQVQ